jgi:hypothetical protein
MVTFRLADIASYGEVAIMKYCPGELCAVAYIGPALDEYRITDPYAAGVF